MPKLKNCPSCYSTDVSSTKWGISNHCGVCNVCGVRGPLEGDAETAERGWNDMPRDPEPITLRESVDTLNHYGHMASHNWTIAKPYGYAMATNGLCNLTELETRGIAREYLYEARRARKDQP